MSMNLIVLQGRLTKDPELKTTPNGVSVAVAGVAVDRYAKAGEEKKCDFFDVQAWRKTGEFLCKYFHKGDAVLIRGQMQSRTWQDKETGKNRVGWNVVADELFFAGKKEAADTSGTGWADEAARMTPVTLGPDVDFTTPRASQPDFTARDYEELDNTDLPF